MIFQYDYTTLTFLSITAPASASGLSVLALLKNFAISSADLFFVSGRQNMTKTTPTKVRAAKLQNAPKAPINFWMYMKLLANPKLHSHVNATVKGYSSPRTYKYDLLFKTFLNIISYLVFINIFSIDKDFNIYFFKIVSTS